MSAAITASMILIALAVLLFRSSGVSDALSWHAFSRRNLYSVHLSEGRLISDAGIMELWVHINDNTASRPLSELGSVEDDRRTKPFGDVFTFDSVPHASSVRAMINWHGFGWNFEMKTDEDRDGDFIFTSYKVLTVQWPICPVLLLDLTMVALFWFLAIRHRRQRDGLISSRGYEIYAKSGKEINEEGGQGRSGNIPK